MIVLNKNEIKKIVMGLLVLALIVIIIGLVIWVIESRRQVEQIELEQFGQNDNRINESINEHIEELELKEEQREVICGDEICDFIELVNKSCPQDCGK